MGDEQQPGFDEWDREFRIAKSGVEHQVRPKDHMPSNMLSAMVASRPGAVFSWCGLDIEHLPPSPTAGDDKPCVRCMRSEYAAE